MRIYCSNCGKIIKTWEKAYFYFELPERSVAEIQAFIKNNSKSYCSDCIFIKK